MKNKKGFTLVELIAVITIISLVSLLSFVSLTKLIKEGEKREIESFEISVKNAAQVFIETDKEKLDHIKENGKYEFNFMMLVDKGYISERINNPTGYELKNITIVVIKEIDDSLSYKLVYN